MGSQWTQHQSTAGSETGQRRYGQHSVQLPVVTTDILCTYTCTVDGNTPTTEVLTSTPTSAGGTGTPGEVPTSTRSDTSRSTQSGTSSATPEVDNKCKG